MLSLVDIERFHEKKQDHHNTHATLLNMWPEMGVERISTIVNHLAYLIVSEWLIESTVQGQTIDIVSLRKLLRWQAFLIMKFQKEGRSLYFIYRWTDDIIFWRAQSLTRDYFVLVDTLINISADYAKFLDFLSLELSSERKEAQG